MRTLLVAAALLSAASVATIAVAQEPKPDEPITPGATVPDARSLASDAEVGQARRAYRAACTAHAPTAFCECITAGVAQALMPSEVRIAARTIGQRIGARVAAPVSSDTAPNGANSQSRIAQVEGHYAEACAAFRRSA